MTRNQLFTLTHTSTLRKHVCGSIIDHAVTMVGYSRDEGLNLDYYIVRNSGISTTGLRLLPRPRKHHWYI
jgi:hypothetical protein